MRPHGATSQKTSDRQNLQTDQFSSHSDNDSITIRFNIILSETVSTFQLLA
jgi:hypothetical protein